MALISYASNLLSNKGDNPEEATWLKNFARLVRSAKVTSHEVTSTLSLLSASVMNGNPLPPYLKAPEPYQLSAKLEAIDADILSINHIAEPGYAAFAVMQVATSFITDDMEKLIAWVHGQKKSCSQLMLLEMSKNWSERLTSLSTSSRQRHPRPKR